MSKSNQNSITKCLSELESACETHSPEGLLRATGRLLVRMSEHLEANQNEKHVRKQQVTKRRGKLLSEEAKREIATSRDHPKVIMERYKVAYSTMQAIKSGTGNYRSYGGSGDNWHLYAGKYSRACRSLRGIHTFHRNRSSKNEERNLDIVTSMEPPEVLMDRLGVSLEVIRHAKAGMKDYARFGGSKELWEEYRHAFYAEIKAMKQQNRNQSGKGD